LQVINGLLETARDEYDAAIIDGKFKEIIEYQDSRGFVQYSNELYAVVASQVKPAAGQKILASLSELKTAWPAPIPPAAPVKMPEQVTALVKDFATAVATVQ
jgi:hypothetical protein